MNWADRGFQLQPVPGAQRLTVDELLAKLQAAQERTPSGITFRSDSAAPVAVDLGRERTLFVNPYAGQFIGEESLQLRAFFSQMEELHRWLGTAPQRRAAGLDKLFACAAHRDPQWTTISLRLPDTRQEALTFSTDQRNGGRPDLRSQITLNAPTGSLVRWEPFSSYNRGRQLRSGARLTHTGEVFGLLEQPSRPSLLLLPSGSC